MVKVRTNLWLYVVVCYEDKNCNKLSLKMTNKIVGHGKDILYFDKQQFQYTISKHLTFYQMLKSFKRASASCRWGKRPSLEIVVPNKDISDVWVTRVLLFLAIQSILIMCQQTSCAFCLDVPSKTILNAGKRCTKNNYFRCFCKSFGFSQSIFIMCYKRSCAFFFRCDL